MAPRIHVDHPLLAGATFALPAPQSRHAQVLRLQPGDALIVFNGAGGEWQACVTRMGRTETEVRIESHVAVDRELPRSITLAVGMPANERMDALIEKATELGAAAVQPLLCERSVLRLDGERAERRRLHWQAVATGAAEQSGRTRVPRIAGVQRLRDWLAALAVDVGSDDAMLSGRGLVSAPGSSSMAGSAGAPGVAPCRYVLSLQHADSAGLAAPAHGSAPLLFLSGPEGGLSPEEEALARRCGFSPVSLGPRVLRADTAPLAVLAWFGLAQQFA